MGVFFKVKKELLLKEERAEAYFNNFLNEIVSMFTPNFEREHYRILLKGLVTWGNMCITKDEAGEIGVFKFNAVHFDRYGEPTDINCYPEFIGTTSNLEKTQPFNRVNGKDAIVIHFNDTHTGDDDIYYYSEMLAEIDLSTKYNILYSRYCPIPIVENDVEKTKVEMALDSIMKGKIVTIVSQSVKRLFSSNSANMPAIETMDLTDVKNSDKIQYLSQAHNSILNRWSSRYGQPITSTDKLAQQTEKESMVGETYTMIYPIQIYECITDDLKKVNEMFGLDWQIEFSKPWEIRLHKIFMECTEENNDIEDLEGSEQNEEDNADNGNSTDME